MVKTVKWQWFPEPKVGSISTGICGREDLNTTMWATVVNVWPGGQK